MTSSPLVCRVDTTDFVPLAPEDSGAEVIDGDSAAQVHTFLANDELWSGIALIQPCTFRYPVEHAGCVHILEGAATITDEEHTRMVGPGDVVFLAPGTVTTWRVTSPIREHFVVRLGSA